MFPLMVSAESTPRKHAACCSWVLFRVSLVDLGTRWLACHWALYQLLAQMPETIWLQNWALRPEYFLGAFDSWQRTTTV